MTKNETQKNETTKLQKSVELDGLKGNTHMKEGYFQHMLKVRKAAARIFPHCGVTAAPFVNRYQGVKLTKRDLEALKRG